MALSDLDVKREIKRLAIAYGKPTEPEDELVRLWRHVLEGVSDSAVHEAVDQYVRSEARYFPRAGMIRAIALEIQAHEYARRPPDSEPPSNWNSLQEGPCPVCGAVLQLAHDPNDTGYTYDVRARRWRKRAEGDWQPPKRYRVLHDGWAHKQAGVPAVGDVVWNRGGRALLPPPRSA